MPAAAASVERLELRLAAEPGSVRAIRHAVRRFAHAHGVEDVDGVGIAVSEAATNAVLHAYREGRAGDVRLVECASLAGSWWSCATTAAA